MKKLSFGKSKGASKGFYLALAISVAAVGTVTYLTLSRLNAPPEETPSQSNTLDNRTEWSIPETSTVSRPKPGVPKETPIVTPESSSSPKQQTVPENPPAPAVKPSKKQEQAAGAFIMPLTGKVTNPYSAGELVKSKTLKEWRTHDGIDIQAAEGTPVKSIQDGKVLDVREDSKWGVTIEMEYPGGVHAFFCGISPDVKVKKGQSVKLGDVIGAVGNTSIVEAAEEPHLHLALQKDGEWIDPMSLIVNG